MQSTIPLRHFVPGLDPAQHKLHCAVWNGHDRPLDVFARSFLIVAPLLLFAVVLTYVSVRGRDDEESGGEAGA
jgi:hypothetical protein